MKLATLDITLKAGSSETTLLRYEFNHALECMGVKPTPWGGMPADQFRHKLTTARKNMLYAPQEFTRCEGTVKVGKNMVTFAKLDVEKVRSILTKLWVFAERAGDNDISF